MPRRPASALVVCLALLAPFFAASGARADIALHLGKIHELKDGALAARGPFAYVALRKLWQEWDRGDPTEVEEALTEIEEGAGVAAPVRAYAGLLHAYARRRRGDLDGAQARVQKLGYVKSWLVVGPFDNEGKGGLDRAYGPEDGTVATLDRAFEGKERSVSWRVSPARAAYGWLDLGAMVRPAENACAYALSYVKDDALKGTSTRPISVWAGSAGAMRVFWNGKEVLKDDKYRSLEADRMAASVTLRAGYNRLLVKACGDDDAPMISVRLAGPDGAPDAKLTTSADASHGAEAQAQKETSTPARVEGPLQAFERQAKGGNAALLEAYARYLVLTSSDDPSEHKAREISRKAADLAPTIPRLLLAGELSESRNQKAIWIERAEAIAKKGASAEDRLAVVLARADHVRTGSNWRDAVPYFDKALAMDPDDVPATLARFDLYSEANLKETALTFLSSALTRRPKSVALVRSMVGALRQQDRTMEASELEERYAQLRFDDAGFARGHVELAIAQRDVASAERWIERLVAANPDEPTILGVAAKSHLVLGDRAKAVGMYKRALDLAPEDTDTLRQLADAYALEGKKEEQVKLLRRILTLKPQDKDVREYVAHMEPEKPRPDETYARPSSEFLARRGDKPGGYDKRTLVNLTVTTVFPNGLASRFHQIVFQPLTSAAAEEARDYGFGFEADSEAVQLRGARVYHENGQVEDASESGEGPANNPQLATYTSARAFYVRFPKLSAGDVVELRYRVEDVAARNAFADYFGEVTYLQSGEPTARAEYVLITPKSRTFYFNEPKVQNLKKTVEEKGDSRVFHFTATDVPPVAPEAEAPPYTEILGHVHVSTYKTWDEMGQWYWGLVKDQFIADDEVRRRVAEVTKGLKTDKEKVRAVYDYVVQKTRYVALEFGIHGFKPYRCAQIFARGFGDCKDKATLIVTMLKEAGIPATIVIVRTGLRGDFETYPASLAPFDHAIAYVPSLDLYLDGTAEYTGSNELPAMDRGSLALQVNEGKAKLVHLPDPPASESVSTRVVDATLAEGGAAVIDWKNEVVGAAASSWRQRYHAESSRKERVQEDLASEFAGIDVSHVDASDMEDVERPVTLHVKGKVPQLARKEGDRLSVPVGPSDHMVRDFASLSQRHLDIRLRAQSTTRSDWTVHLPRGARVVSLPSRAEGKTPFGTFKVDVEQTGGDTGSTVRVRTEVTMDKTRIPVAEYPAFRAFCEAVDRALGQRLVVAGASR